MKTIIVVAAFLFILGGCNNRTEELENQNSKLEITNNMLAQDLAARDSYIEEITLSINDVYHSLERVQAKEKSMLKGTGELSVEKTMSNAQARENVKNKLTTIGEELKNNRLKLDGLQSKLKSYKTQFAGLNKMVDNLKHSLEEREQALALMYTKVQDLEQNVAEKTKVITEKETTISEQQNVINTGYYIIGTKDELKEKGIITDEGGFMWGLLGSTTILESGFDKTFFKPIDKTMDASIEVTGSIDEILPKRSEEFYSKTNEEGHKTLLKITRPDKFWQDKYLVIITG